MPVSELHSQRVPVPSELTIADAEELIKILIGIERDNLQNFKGCLTEIFVQNNSEERERQQRHFIRLNKNLALVNRTQFKVFPEYFAQIFDTESTLTFDDSALNEIDKSYRLLIDSLESDGVSMSPEEIISGKPAHIPLWKLMVRR